MDAYKEVNHAEMDVYMEDNKLQKAFNIEGENNAQTNANEDVSAERESVESDTDEEGHDVHEDKGVETTIRLSGYICNYEKVIPPKEYIDKFSDENVAQGVAPKPPLPLGAPHFCFGKSYETIDLLKGFNVHTTDFIGPIHGDPRKELKRLNNSLFVKFLDLLDTLSNFIHLDDRNKQVQQIHDLFENFNAHINCYRPHQARETLRMMKELGKRACVETGNRFEGEMKRVREMIEAAFSSIPEMEYEMDEIQLPGVINNNNKYVYPLDRIMCKIADKMEEEGEL